MKIKLVKKKELYNPYRDGVTNSILSMWQACPTKARLYLQGYRKPKSSRALMFGDIFHYGLEVTYKKIMKGEKKIDQFLKDKKLMIFEPLLKKYEDEQKEEFILNAQTALAILPFYFKAYKEDFNRDWLGVEKVFCYNSGGPIDLRGKRDKEYQGKDLRLLETKTKARWNDYVLGQLLTIEQQVLTYLLSLYFEYGKYPGGVKYNIIRSPKEKKKSESLADYLKGLTFDVEGRPDFYFVRLNQDISVQAMKLYTKKLNNMLEKFVEWWHSDPVLDARNTGNCEGKFGCCHGLKYCVSGGKFTHDLIKVDHLMEELRS